MLGWPNICQPNGRVIAVSAKHCVGQMSVNQMIVIAVSTKHCVGKMSVDQNGFDQKSWSL